MPSALRDEQYELLNEDESISVVFGTTDTGYLALKPPTFSLSTGRNGDVQRFQEDGAAGGVDYLGGKTATFELGVLTTDDYDPYGANLDALDALEAVWRDDRFRSDPSAYAILRSRVVGRTRRAYGRPRRFEDSPGQTTPKGYTPLVCDFALSANAWFDDTVSQQTLATATVASANIYVGGTEKAWPVLTFTGGTNPSVDLGSFTVGLVETLAADTSITVDLQPWARSVIRDDGVARPGSITKTTPPFRKCFLRPGAAFADYSGGGSVRIQWRNAYARP